MSGHTPGPWHINREQVEVIEGKLSVESDDGYFIAQVDEGDAQNGNAQLIAAAPELLAACIEFVRKCDAGEAKSKRSYAQMSAAIAKATNQQGNNYD